MYQPDQPDYRRLFIAILLSAALLMLWQAFVEWPRRQKLAEFQAGLAENRAKEQVEYIKSKSNTISDSADMADNSQLSNQKLSRKERLELSPRLRIASDKLHGSIALRGARFDDITLARYRETLEKDSKEVILLSPSGDDKSYYAQTGWLAADGKTKVPDNNSLWQADAKTIIPGKPVTLRWDNGSGVSYELIISLDTEYMFNIEQRVKNNSGSEINVVPFGFINRAYSDNNKIHNVILHEGPMGVVAESLKEIPYKEIMEKGNQTFENSSSWLGITDKYWLAALVPSGKENFKSTYSYYQKNNIDRFQVDYIRNSQTINHGAESSEKIRLFAGAKEIEVLDRYTRGENGEESILLFDRAVDLGVLYFLTKPLFLLLNLFYKMVGNFGIAIFLLTLVVKICLFPLANAGYKSAASMRRLQPEMAKLKERYEDDRLAFQKELMALYKREKVNPAAGCLPILIQMPVFFALYKVLFVTIEMRHAPFFFWIRDLSAMDHSNIFTLFGLLPWNTPSFLHLGVLPIIMCATMVLQMRQQPTPPDPVQAKVIKFMPYMFLFMFASFPAGLVLYWIFSNIFSIIQQEIISRKYRK